MFRIFRPWFSSVQGWLLVVSVFADFLDGILGCSGLLHQGVNLEVLSQASCLGNGPLGNARSSEN